MHSSRVRTTRMLTVSRSIRRRGSAQPPSPDTDSPIPPDPAPPPGGRPPLDADTPSPGGRHTLHWCRSPLPWTEGMTHACENITLPLTSFAGGKYKHWFQEFFKILWPQKRSSYTGSRLRVRSHLFTPKLFTALLKIATQCTMLGPVYTKR